MKDLQQEYDRYRVRLDGVHIKRKLLAREPVDHPDSASWAERYNDLLTEEKTLKGAMMAVADIMLDSLEG